jgi:uncharacterized protein YecE (DUF72 family)
MDSRIEKLKQFGIYLGTSSWKYPGWKGLIYHEQYKSEKAFKEDSLKEYSHAFSAVGVDHTYYAFPSQQQLTTYQKETPPDFKFIFKAPEQATIYRYPRLPRYGKVAGTANEHFLDPHFLEDSFLNPLKTLEKKAGAVVFEFSKFRTGMIESGSEFVRRLATFLSAVRKKTDIPLAIEIRNKNWLVGDYFKVLKDNEVAHVFNSWTEMPEVGEQWNLALPFDLPFSIVRLLLKPGTAYQTAVDTFSPYDKLHLELTQTRQASAKLIRASMEKTKLAYVLVNNRFEGCAPKTIEGILDLLEIKE